MPSPSKTSFLASLAVTAGIFTAGAWIASTLPAAHATGVAEPAMAADGLSLTISGVRGETGSVIVLVFDDADAYAEYDFMRAAGYAEIPAATGDVTHRFRDLTSGPYAVVLFHDEDGDEELTYSGALPIEGYGISGASDAYDEPSFAEAARPAGPVTVEMHYLRD